jgi:thiamine transporter ThiT
VARYSQERLGSRSVKLRDVAVVDVPRWRGISIVNIQQVPSQSESTSRLAPRSVRYWKAAIVGGILWEILGLLFGELLLNHSLTWEAPTLMQQLAGIGFMILALPFALILESIEGKLLISFFLNGSLWGLVVAFVFNTISARRQQKD